MMQQKTAKTQQKVRAYKAPLRDVYAYMIAVHHLLSLLQSLGGLDFDGLHHRRFRLLFLLRQLPSRYKEADAGEGTDALQPRGMQGQQRSRRDHDQRWRIHILVYGIPGNTQDITLPRYQCIAAVLQRYCDSKTNPITENLIIKVTASYSKQTLNFSMARGAP